MNMSGSASPATATNGVLTRRVRGQVVMLAVQLALGMGVNLIGLPEETSGVAKASTSALLGLHILVSLGLLVGAALTIWRSGPLELRTTRQAWAGGILVLVTVLTGVLTMITDNGWWSYLMTVGFLASFLVYGAILVQAGRTSRSQ
jgi:hypothetical protein